jgi:VIT1/CCC1 family predicted Fe2+/Mn2+ transporter
MVGLLIFVMAVFFFLQKKDVAVPVALQAVGLALVILFYAFTILKDLQKGEKAIEAVLTKALVNPREMDSENEPIEDEGR